MAKKRIAILGSTGSIGESALRVVQHLSEELEVVCLAARSNIDRLYEQALEFSPQLIAVYEPMKAAELQKRLPTIPIVSGKEGLEEVASLKEVDFVLLAMTGSVGIFPAAAAICAKKQVGLANKEILVCAGEWISSLAKEHGVELLPVDSEHCALHQCLKKEDLASVRRLILTASGGALRDKTQEELSDVSPKDALCHPNWKMGPKVTVDCSTLMNKGLEMIEARYLFGIEPEKIEAIIHPESLVHSFVEMVDGSILAMIAEPDMVLPIQYAMTYPKRKAGLLAPYNFLKHSTMHFFEPDTERFRCLQIAIEAMRLGKSYPCVLNAANEVLVERFLRQQITWKQIGEKLDKLISLHRPEDMVSLEAVLSVDQQAREHAYCI